MHKIVSQRKLISNLKISGGPAPEPTLKLEAFGHSGLLPKR